MISIWLVEVGAKVLFVGKLFLRSWMRAISSSVFAEIALMPSSKSKSPLTSTALVVGGATGTELAAGKACGLFPRKRDLEGGEEAAFSRSPSTARMARDWSSVNS